MKHEWKGQTDNEIRKSQKPCSNTIHIIDERAMRTVLKYIIVIIKTTTKNLQTNTKLCTKL